VGGVCVVTGRAMVVLVAPGTASLWGLRDRLLKTPLLPPSGDMQGSDDGAERQRTCGTMPPTPGNGRGHAALATEPATVDGSFLVGLSMLHFVRDAASAAASPTVPPPSGGMPRRT
jgi:hypothetical protein